jgi:hypothetical protein
MRFAAYAGHLIELARLVLAWVGDVRVMDRGRREKVALYAEEIAATLARASAALAKLQGRPGDGDALLVATRELGRVAGYVETILAALETHLDGRRRASLKRRLELLEPFELEQALADNGAFRQASKLASAEGFFRALADAMRT